MALRIAIIGLGVIGNVHAEVLSTLGTPAAALCDLDAEKAELVRQKFAPDAKIYTDWREMLRDFSPDVVHICTPHDLHAEMTVTALDADIHVLCEKPLCIRHEDIARILAAEERTQAKLGVCHQNRYNAVNVFLKHYLADKKILGAHGSVVWKRTKDYYASAPWRGTMAHEGGGVLINQALHTFDLMMWLCGEPREIAAINGNLTLPGEIEVEDTIAVRCFGMTDYSFFATVGAAHTFPVEMQFKLANGEHVLVLPKTVTVDGQVVETDEITRSFGKSCYGDGHIRLIDDFYRCLAQNEPFPVNGAEAAKVVRMILAAYQSKGERITL
ncbi:MAG: Gfo/Idh/MocA family oxidoreductase [Clostridia bacterium]|nr:Gfo/Idh/MocA family oxidoreductase [Clostridia bacterium]